MQTLNFEILSLIIYLCLSFKFYGNKCALGAWHFTLCGMDDPF